MEDRCVMCGKVIPEGRMVCPGCEEKYQPKQNNLSESEWKVPVVWSMMGYYSVTAPTKEVAIRKVSQRLKDYHIPLPSNGAYLEDSLQIDEEGEPLEVVNY